MSASFDEDVDFEAAEGWLRKAKEADAAQDADGYIRARYLLAVSLNMTGGLGDVRMHTAHLKVS